MRVLLVGAEVEENLATRYLASSLEREGHRADLTAFSNVSETTEVLAAARRTRPDVIGLSMTFQRRAHEFGALADALRKDGFAGHVTCGGHFPTFAYDDVLSHYRSIDTVVRHEGEKTLPELCAALATPERSFDRVSGIAYRGREGCVVVTKPRPLESDLDSLAFPKRVGDAQVHMGIPAAFMVGSRGCYGHCTFCCINAYVKDAGGARYRERSADNIADELRRVRRERGARMIIFHDDDFFTRNHERDLARVTALRDALRRRDVNDLAFVVKARPDDLDDRVFAVLREIGLLRVYIGIEAGSTQGLKTLGRGVDVAQNERALAFLRRLDVYACYNMLVFDPDSTIRSLRSSFGFVRDNADVPMNFCRTEIYPGTPLHLRLSREERLIGDSFGWDYEISDAPAERAFRIFARSFLDRNFRCDGLMNSTLGLGYHLHLLRHFYPRTLTSDLRANVEHAIRKVNLDCVDRMSRVIDFAEREPSSRLGDEFAMQTLEEVTRANRSLEDEVASATEACVRAAQGVRSPSMSSRSLLFAAAAATLAFSPLGCTKSPPPPDPLPPPREITADDTGPEKPPAKDGGAGVVTPKPDAAATAVPPMDPLPPPTYMPPPDPLPPPTYLPPPDPPPPPTTKKHPMPPPPDPLPPPKIDAGKKSPF